MKKNVISEVEEEYWYCPRCKIDSLGTMMCPCPRGSCEADVVGKTFTTISVEKDEKKMAELNKGSLKKWTNK